MDFQPDTALDDLYFTPAPTDSVEPTQTCWNAMLGEVHKAIQVTLEELALLAGVATAATEVSGFPRADSPEEPSLTGFNS